MKNIFEVNTEFVELDNRRLRTTNICSPESLFNKFIVQLPADSIKDKTILDLGSCIGAAGHWALHHGAKHYTGIEFQDYYAQTSRNLMSKYWDKTQFTIIQQDIEYFLDQAINNNQKFDYVLAAGILYGFLDLINLLKKIALVTNEVLIIDTESNPADSNDGVITIKKSLMVRAEDANTQNFYSGLGAVINLKGLDLVLENNGFYRKDDILVPAKIDAERDMYNDLFVRGNGIISAPRFIARYLKGNNKNQSIQDVVLTKDNTNLVTFDNVKNTLATREKVTDWVFDQNVAARFQKEAEQHIPDYHRVIDLSLSIAETKLVKTDYVIDVGSALGYTVAKFVDAGYTNMQGVEQSIEMINSSNYRDRIIHSNNFPKKLYQLVLINWTLHFLRDKVAYLSTVYDQLDRNGILILSDKTTQSYVVKHLYYEFKRNNGVSQEYILAKEELLKNSMFTETPDWYLTTLKDVGFRTIEIVNARLGFVTFYCVK